MQSKEFAVETECSISTEWIQVRSVTNWTSLPFSNSSEYRSSGAKEGIAKLPSLDYTKVDECLQPCVGL